MDRGRSFQRIVETRANIRVAGRGMNLIAEPIPVTPRGDEYSAGEHGAHEQTVPAVARDDTRHNDDEGAGRPADLYPRAAEERDQGPATTAQ